MQKTTGLQRATGRDQSEWFALLDDWGAKGRPYREIADWLCGEHQLSRWWAQKLIVEYEQERGIRPPEIRPGGTFEVGSSKTVAAPVERAYEAFVDERRRNKWLTDAKLSLSNSQPARSARFDWEDGGSRVNVIFQRKGPSKTTVSVTHGQLPNQREAERTKARWKSRLDNLKTFLES
jgi:hypothetical protein